MKIETNISTLILFCFVFILLAVILLELVYFEVKLVELVELVNYIAARPLP